MTYSLHQGDCREVLKAIPERSVDAIISDPPYGTKVERDGYGRRRLYSGKQHIEGDESLESLEGMLAEVGRTLKTNAWVVLFCSPKLHAPTAAVIEASELSIVGEIVWDKLQPGLGGGIRYQHELILLCGLGKPRGRSGLLSVQSQSVLRRKAGTSHPHEKPTALLRKLIDYTTKSNDLILDPFMGSGSTGVACLQTGRRFAGVELDPRWFTLASKRIQEAANSSPLLDGYASTRLEKKVATPLIRGDEITAA